MGFISVRIWVKQVKLFNKRNKMIADKKLKTENYIKERTEFFKKNIDEFEIDEVVKEKAFNFEAIILDKTANSLFVHTKKRKPEGTDCTGWFSIDDFNRRFKKQ